MLGQLGDRFSTSWAQADAAGHPMLAPALVEDVLYRIAEIAYDDSNLAFLTGRSGS